MLNNPNMPPAPGQTPPATGDPPGQTPPNNSPGQTPPTSGNTQHTSLDTLPPDVQEYIKSLRKEAKTNREQLDAQNQQRQQAEEARLKEQGEFKALAEKHEARVKELEPIAERYNTLATQIRENVKKETKDWPAEIKAFYPGDEAPVEQVQEWYNRSKPLIEKLNAQVRGGAQGNTPNPPPANSQARAQQAKDETRRDLMSRRMYGI